MNSRVIILVHRGLILCVKGLLLTDILFFQFPESLESKSAGNSLVLSAVSIAGAPVYSKDLKKPFSPSVVVGGTVFELSTGAKSNVIIVYALSPNTITTEESKDTTASDIIESLGVTCSGKFP